MKIKLIIGEKEETMEITGDKTVKDLLEVNGNSIRNSCC